MARRSAPTGILAALNAEWQSLIEDTRAKVHAWGSTYPELAACHDLRDVLDSVAERPDQVLRRLLSIPRLSPRLLPRSKPQQPLLSKSRKTQQSPQHESVAGFIFLI